MAGCTIHIACATEYAKKHHIDNLLEFIEGTLEPDLVKDKVKSHYGPKPRFTNPMLFLEEHTLEKDFDKGRFFHLVTDYYFYQGLLKNVDFTNIGETLHQDYDVLNEYIINKYQIPLPDSTNGFIKYTNNSLNYLSRELVDEFIEFMSNIELEQYTRISYNKNIYQKKR